MVNLIVCAITTEEVAVVKDWHWFFIFAAILITPLLPVILREKCPACKRRKLQSFDTLKLLSEEGPSAYSYLTFFRCDKCKSVYKRNRTKPLEPSSQEEYKLLSEAAITAQSQA